ncbi:DUF1800 domain-containing protein [Phycisphaeraceae bacterium D3-23]
MPPNPSLSPIASRDFSPAFAWHLLSRAGFGGSPAAVAQLHGLGLDGAVRRLVRYQQVDLGGLAELDLDPDVIAPRSQEDRQALVRARREGDGDTVDRITRKTNVARAEDRRMHLSLQTWWLERMIQTPRPMEEKLTLLWHSHFATRHRDIRDSFLMQQQNAMFRANANGSFADLAAGIVRDPAMIRFLNNDRNNARRPNENLARELMELFTLGEGHYTEADIREGARTLTGYTVNDNDFAFNQRAHDQGRKAILNEEGWWDGDDFVQLLLRQQACARFVALKLYRHFVADVSDDWDLVPGPQRRVIDALAGVLRDEDYALAPALEHLFKSRHFYDTEIIGRKIKSPVQLMAGTARALDTPMRDGRGLTRGLRAMGQDLFEPPSVAGWDGGRSWINTSTLLLRQNICTYLITGKDPSGQWRRSQMDYEPMALLAGLDNPAPRQTVDHLCDSLLGPHVSADRRASLYQFLESRTTGVTPDTVTGLLLLITAMPEYQLC